MQSNKELTIPNWGLLLGIPLCGMIYRLMALYIQYIYMHRLQTNGFPFCLATHVYTRRLYELISEANGQMVLELLCVYIYIYIYIYGEFAIWCVYIYIYPLVI